MPSNYRTPDVYIEEAVQLPSTIMQVETSIPVFIGITEKAVSPEGEDLARKAFAIHSFWDYTNCYGEATSAVEIHLNNKRQPSTASLSHAQLYQMHWALKSFFDNGGGKCYIYSTGYYPTTETADTNLHDSSSYYTAFEHLQSISEITLLVLPDLTLLGEKVFYEVYKKALTHCAEIRNRFLLIDVFAKYNDSGTDLLASVAAFRENIKGAALHHGAAYFPNLTTNYQFNLKHSQISFVQKGLLLDGLRYDDCLQLIYVASFGKLLSKCITGITQKNKASRSRQLSVSLSDTLSNVEINELRTLVCLAAEKVQESLLPDSTLPEEEKQQAITSLIQEIIEKANQEFQRYAISKKIKINTPSANLHLIKSVLTNKFQSSLSAALSGIQITIPPAAAMAGIYCQVDRTRGVWKAPAGIALHSVIEPVLLLNDNDQAELNSHISGISINAIRSFEGRGVQVWGARTLDGNNNEWRYVPVRRFCDMVEASISNALAPFAFEANTANTWLKVNLMISNFLVQQWRAGGLMGTKPEQAFYIAIGLNKTMTQQDLLEGRMIVQVGMAVVKPAEFIIIKIIQKMAV